MAWKADREGAKVAWELARSLEEAYIANRSARDRKSTLVQWSGYSLLALTVTTIVTALLMTFT